MYKKIALTSVLLLLLFAVSCGESEPEFDLSLLFYELEGDWGHLTDLIPLERDYDLPEFDWEQLRDYERDADRRHIADVSPFYGETLTILVDHDWFSRHRLRIMADSFVRMHPGVNVEFTFLHDLQRLFDSPYNDYEDIMCLLRAGDAPLLMQTSSTGLRRSFMNTEKRGFFADWLPVMANHPDFDTDDWNMNVINASRIHGELFVFPAFQNVQLIAANRGVPGLAQMFEVKESISASELLYLYDMHRGFDAGAYITNEFIAWYIRSYVLPNFIDIHNGTVVFDTEEFIELLQNLYFNVYFLEEWNIVIDHNRYNFNFELDRILRENFFFRTLRSFDYFETFSFTRYDAYFINPLPFVTDDGRLKAFSSWLGYMYSWILNTHDPVSQALAAEFLLYMANIFGDNNHSPFYDPAGMWSLMGIPAKLSAAERFASEVERHWRRRSNFDDRLPHSARQWREGYCHETAAEEMEAIIYRLRNMEMVKVEYTEYLNTILWEETLYFVDGTRTAEQTARRLQDRVTAYFLEWNRR